MYFTLESHMMQANPRNTYRRDAILVLNTWWNRNSRECTLESRVIDMLVTTAAFLVMDSIDVLILSTGPVTVL